MRCPFLDVSQYLFNNERVFTTRNDVNPSATKLTGFNVDARNVTNCRPFKTPIYAFANNSRTRRQLALNRNLVPKRATFSSDPEKTLKLAFKILTETEGFADNQQVVVISDIIAGTRVDAIQVRNIE